MGIGFIIALICLIIIAGTAGHMATQGWSRSLIGITLTIGMAINLSIVIHIATNAVNNAYAAAARQDITITVKTWEQRPVATKPCRVELKLEGSGKEAKLILPNSGKTVTAAMLSAICGDGD